MTLIPVLNIPAFDVFFTISIYFSILLGTLFGAGSLLKGD